jgi:uncharacterized membrane protein
MKFIKRQLGFLLYGIVFWLPIGVIVLVAKLILGDLDNIGRDLLKLFVPDEFVYAGLGIVLWLVIFFLTGLLVKLTPVGDLFSRVPILGMFIRRGGEIITIDKLISLTPCLFLYSPTCISYGWILSEEKVKLDNENSPFSLVNVYYPNVPTILTGQVYSVRKETVMKLANPSREIIDILLYGLRRPEILTYLPWEDESTEEFIERAKRFGLGSVESSAKTPVRGKRP